MYVTNQMQFNSVITLSLPIVTFLQAKMFNLRGGLLDLLQLSYCNFLIVCVSITSHSMNGASQVPL